MSTRFRNKYKRWLKLIAKNKESSVKIFKVWWEKYSNHIYGMSGVLSMIVAIIALFPVEKDEKIDNYFKNIDRINLRESVIPLDTMLKNQGINRREIFLSNQVGTEVDVWGEQYDFKLIVVTSKNSPCKRSLETISIVKKQLSPFLSIQSYAILGDSIHNKNELQEFVNGYNLDLIALFGSYKDVVDLAYNQLYLTIAKENNNKYIHTEHILLIHKRNAYYIDGHYTSAQELTYAILEEFRKDKEGFVVGKKALNEITLSQIAANAKTLDQQRIFSADCKENVAAL